MIYGKGLIAKSFSKYKKNRKFIFFASGVSNSLETNFSKYNREIQLLKKVLLKKPRKDFNDFFEFFLNDFFS